MSFKNILAIILLALCVSGVFGYSYFEGRNKNKVPVISVIDNVLEVDGRLHPFEVKCKDNLNAYDMRGIRAFRETYGDAAGHGAIIYAGRDAYKIDEKTWAVPWTAT